MLLMSLACDAIALGSNQVEVEVTKLLIPIEQRIHPRFADWKQIAVRGQKPFKKKICVLCIHRFDVFTE